MEQLVSEIGNIASFIGSLTVVGGALLWVYNKLIAKPREKRREREENKKHEQMMKIIIRESEPLNNSIKQLNEWLLESKTDRKKLNEIAEHNLKTLKEHDDRLDHHNDRLIVLETKNGIRTYSYKGSD